MAVAFQASGSAFRVNTQTLGNQEGPDVAVLSTGGFVVDSTAGGSAAMTITRSSATMNATGVKANGAGTPTTSTTSSTGY